MNAPESIETAFRAVCGEQGFAAAEIDLYCTLWAGVRHSDRGRSVQAALAVLADYLESIGADPGPFRAWAEYPQRPYLPFTPWPLIAAGPL